MDQSLEQNNVNINLGDEDELESGTGSAAMGSNSMAATKSSSHFSYKDVVVLDPPKKVASSVNSISQGVGKKTNDDNDLNERDDPERTLYTDKRDGRKYFSGCDDPKCGCRYYRTGMREESRPLLNHTALYISDINARKGYEACRKEFYDLFRDHNIPWTKVYVNTERAMASCYFETHEDAARAQKVLTDEFCIANLQRANNPSKGSFQDH